MKTHLFLIASLLVSLSASAATLTVDNNPGGGAMYDNFADAYDAAVDGDTILITATAFHYGTHTLYKQLTIIGEGYLLSNNSIPGLTTHITSIYLNFGFDAILGDSSNSKIMGLLGIFKILAGTSGIEIKRCYINASYFDRYLDIDGPAVVRECYIVASPRLTSGAAGSLFSNSIFQNITLTFPQNNPVTTQFDGISSVNTTINNCIFNMRLDGSASMGISNCIFSSTLSVQQVSNGASFSHCLLTGKSPPAGTGNIDGTGLSDSNVFINSGTSDAKWQLKAGSPAIGAGVGGIDMGAFGGVNPYVLSGLPGIPRLTRLDVPSSANNVSGVEFEVDAQAIPE